MPDYTRALSHRLPLLRGTDVVAVQERLRDLGFAPGRIDGLYGRGTETAVREFQAVRGLKVDGIVGPRTWTALFAEHGQARIERLLPELTTPHAYRDSVAWCLHPDGLRIDGSDTPEVWGGPPRTVRRVWRDYGDAIAEWAHDFGVPAELIVATICTESRGRPTAIRIEPGYVSDAQTPHRISPGLMQTLISTARAALGADAVDREWLLVPSNSIRAGTAYIAQQWKQTHFHAPKVACAYNAGGIYFNNSEANRWRIRQYPIGTGEHADRFVKWFNECLLMFDLDGTAPSDSFSRLVSDEADGD